MKKLFTYTLLLFAFLLTAQTVSAQTALYGRPIGAFWAGLKPEGTPIGYHTYLVIPAGVEVTFPNLSSNGSSYYWNYYVTSGSSAEATSTDATATVDDLTITYPESLNGKNVLAPAVFADDNSYQIGYYGYSKSTQYVHIGDGVYTNSSGTEFWLSNHAPNGSAKWRRYHAAVDSMSFNNANTVTFWAGKTTSYTVTSIDAFAEYFRQPLKPYVLDAVNVMIFMSDDQKISDSGVNLVIKKAKANSSTGALSGISSTLATWTATSSDVTAISDAPSTTSTGVSGTFYMLSFKCADGEELTIDSPIIMQLSLADGDTESNFTVCHSYYNRNLGATDHSSYVYISGTNSSDEAVSGVRLQGYWYKSAAFNTGTARNHYVRSFCFYMHAKYCETITIGETGYATLYYGSKNLIVPTGVTATAYVVNDGELSEAAVYNAGDIIPAGTGVVLYDGIEESKDYYFQITSEEGTAPSENALYGTDEATTITSPEGDYKYYMLSTKDGADVGFYYGADDGAAFENAAHRAYLAVAETSSTKPYYLFNNATTGVTTVEIATDQQRDDAIYDLSGRRVETLQKGIYIKNGKKIVVR